MTLELTEHQQQALTAQSGAPVIGTNTPYVLLRADLYERLKAVLADELHPSESYPAVDRAFDEGWNAPGMDDYDRYEELKR